MSETAVNSIFHNKIRYMAFESPSGFLPSLARYPAFFPRRWCLVHGAESALPRHRWRTTRHLARLSRVGAPLPLFPSRNAPYTGPSYRNSPGYLSPTRGMSPLGEVPGLVPR